MNKKILMTKGTKTKTKHCKSFELNNRQAYSAAKTSQDNSTFYTVQSYVYLVHTFSHYVIS